MIPPGHCASFDDPNLVSRAGVVSVMAAAGRCGLADLAGEHVRIGSRVGRERAPEGPLPGAGMAAGAGSIDDMDVLRHGAMKEARCHERCVQRHPGPVHAGVVPAVVHLGQP
jgi:hypothetical protein